MYFTKTKGIGGTIKERIEDFVVEEIPKETEEGEHTVFWLEKSNWDTNRAILVLAKRLGVSRKRFGIAGTKDKRAVTKQRVSAWNIPEERLKEVEIKDMKLYGFSKGERLSMGDSKGNKFIITVRNIDLEEKEIEKRIKGIFSELKKGIPNVFGPQRFGEIRPITHLVGEKIIEGDLEGAARIYLTETFEMEPEDAKEARKFLENNWSREGFRKALEMFPKRLGYERTMIAHLAEIPTDFGGALRKLPKRLRRMFVNAVQSREFNKKVEKLYQEGKLKDEKIPLRAVKIKKMPEISPMGSERSAVLKPRDLELMEIDDDDLNEGRKKVVLSFSLPPGSYATVVLREVIK